MRILGGKGDVPHWECVYSVGMGCASLGMCILGGNGDVPHWECIHSVEMGMCLTGKAYTQWECGCAAPNAYTSGNEDVPLQELGFDSTLMQILTGNAQSLHRVAH